MRRQWTTFLRILQYGVRNLSRNAWLTTAAAAVMTITLVIIASTLLARMVFNDTIQQVRQKIDVSVYLKDGIAEEDLQRFITQIKKVPIVTSVEYISKDQASLIFQQQNKTELTRLEALTQLSSNPLPASLKIKVKDPNKIDDLNKVISSDQNKDLLGQQSSNSESQKQAVKRIADVTQFLESAGVISAVIFVIISVLIIFNTIRMAIFNRKDEIEIMRLIGAEKYFIRGPFIVEASLYGVLSAIVSITFVYALLLTKADYIASQGIEIGGTIHFMRQWPVLIVLGQIAVGIAIGIISSLLAMRRYLKL
ncbi:MAG TPA: permease-like cell division protein FtsX [Patescibacteria group bacterium]|jgi:cell division transport system permease protein|nr:permease-like cell division protein FtsX [Patescibacteria group bacterium]